MILSDREIRAARSRGAVRITPAPALEMYSSTAIDLTLGTELRKWKELQTAGVAARIRPGSPAFNVGSILDQLTDRFTIPPTVTS